MCRRATIIGTGSYVPKKIRLNDFFEKVGSSDKWIQSKLGIKERHLAADNEATSDLAANAALNAIENAGLKPEDIDLIIMATISPDRKFPSTACFVQYKIKAFNAAAFDMQAACSGFVYAMFVAREFIRTGTYDNVLVIGGDIFSKVTDYDRRDSVFFGDGAGAAVLSHTEEGGFLAYKMAADGTGRYAVTIPGGGSEMPITPEVVEKKLHYWQMDVHAVYKAATTVLPKVIGEVLEMANLTVDDIDWVIPHQPGKSMLHDIMDKAVLPWDKVVTNMDKYANTSSGTVPIMLDETHRAGTLKKGDLVLFVAVGAGLTWSASVLKWGIDY
ncbi:MAG TPA: beta-ketoacyl-ACP synthase III [Victivallales bacterium]|nr:beta-ketoacyl-ACP synthase III [Victivallales bacterium]